MKVKNRIRAVACASAFIAVFAAALPATAQNIYMTGTSNPWGTTTNDDAMNQAFGAGNWIKFNGFDASVFNPVNKFIFFDGGDRNGTDFGNFINGNLTSLTNFVNGGGKILANAAFNNGPSTLNMGFGQTLTFAANYADASNTATVNAAGIAAGLSGNGAGTSFSGTSFSHNAVTGGNCLITGTAGCIFAGGAQGAGAYFVGGQTTTNFHSPGAAAFQLRVNELNLVSGFEGVGAVPEPETWALMLLGFAFAGAAMRRKKGKVSTSVSFA